MREVKFSDLPLPLRARLYNEADVKNLDLTEIKEYLKEKGLFEEVETFGSFPKMYGKPVDETASKIAKTRVRNPETPKIEFEPFEESVRLERELIEGDRAGVTSVLYDGFRLAKSFTDLIPEDERDDYYLHVVFTDRFFATWKPATQRYHSRVSVYGFPSIISTTGIVDAPARPRGFHRVEASDDSAGSDDLEVKGTREEFRGQFVDYDDERLTEIMKGYAMQAVFYHLSRGPFCEHKNCRLYNPHLQKNILNAQLTKPEFCVRHQKLLEKFQEEASR